MSPLHSFARLSKCVITKQVKFFNNLYGAACDHQYVRTDMPTMAKRMTITRQLLDENKGIQKMQLVKVLGGSAVTFTSAQEAYGTGQRCQDCYNHWEDSDGCEWRQIRLQAASGLFKDLNCTEQVHSKAKSGSGVCEECGGPLHLPRVPVQKEERDAAQDPGRIPEIGNQTPKPGVKTPNIPHHWHNPVATRKKMMNATDGAAEGFIKHNSSIF